MNESFFDARDGSRHPSAVRAHAQEEATEEGQRIQEESAPRTKSSKSSKSMKEATSTMTRSHRGRPRRRCRNLSLRD
jgi:hypothetical protein